MPNRRNFVKGFATAMAAVLTTFLLPATASVAQMRPGAKVEKTYGLGLPRGRKLSEP